MLKKKYLAILLVIAMSIAAFWLAGCNKKEENKNPVKTPVSEQPATGKKVLKLATTTSTADSGLLDYLLPVLEKDIGYTVKVIPNGSGQAIKMGETGDVDVLLVHSRKAEDEFMAKGFGKDRFDVMYNDFLIIGPASDPAKVKGQKTAVEAFKKIAAASATFLSRGDDSGTDKKEKSIWEKAAIKPAGVWYVSIGQGMGDTFRVADEKMAYTLIDRATFLALKDKYKLVILMEGDQDLLNPYGVITVNPAKHPKVDYNGALKFARWMTSDKGQKMIGQYGKDKYGQALFVPDAKPVAK